jgi:hypothetical protein
LKILSARIRRRAAVCAVTLGAVAAPVVALTPQAHASVAVPQVVYFCNFNVGPTGVRAYCDGENAAVLTVVCTNGTVSDLAFLPATLQAICPSGGTVVRYSLS